MGSGTTGVAALELGHRFIGIEIDKDHFLTAKERLN
jgi:site-specific DNA-methyltransferase (adenine-specific)